PQGKQSLVVEAHVPGHGHDALHPADYGWIGLEVEIGLVGDMGIGKQADVGEAELVGDEPLAVSKVSIHQVQRLLATFALSGNLHALGVAQRINADEPQPEAQGGDIRLVAILLPEHPPKHVRKVEMAVRHKAGTIAEEEADCIALAERPVAVLEHRDPAIGTYIGEIFRGASFALHHVVAPPLQRDLKMRGGETDLVAIARPGVFVKDQPVHCPVTSTILPTWSPA